MTQKLEDGRGADEKDCMLGTDGSGNAYPARVNSSGQLVIAALKGENATDDRLYGGNKPASKTALTTTGAIKAGAGSYYGYKVTTALGAGAITLYDNASAASGTVIDSIAASTAAGTTVILASPIPCSAGMYANFASTGTVLFLYT